MMMNNALHLNDTEVAQRLSWPALIAAIEGMLLGAVVAPSRQNYPLTGPDGRAGQFLMMPAWTDDCMVGIKLVTAWPDNVARGLPNHGASYILFDAHSGEVRAVLAAEALTHCRTAAVSVLAASRLLPDGADSLLVVGTGPVAEQVVRAHAFSGRFSTITLYGRAADKAAALVAALGDLDVQCRVAPDLEAAVRSADMVVGATGATSPWLRGDWLRPEAHVDLIGGYTSTMREGDDRLVARATAIWVDTLDAIGECGDLVQPLAASIIDRTVIKGDLAMLLRAGLSKAGEPRGPGITVFKSVGIAAADLATARLVLAG